MFLISQQLLPTTSVRNVWRQERRICILMLGLKGLNRVGLHESILVSFVRSVLPNSDTILTISAILHKLSFKTFPFKIVTVAGRYF